ncbi:NfeD family protein [Actinopolymorpha alba]|uniref:NfeD family protein n=1 Tax=Actinopolymorpha alba TaxID=533267 RepID=UPI00036C79CF|nr:NfeD family protein [Actinopolymorpha alba]
MSNLLNWLGDNLWVAWIVVAGLLAAIELLTLDLIFLMLAAGAVAGAGAAILGAGPVISILVAVVFALSMLGVVRPVAIRHLKQGPGVRTGIAALVGKTGVVVEPVHANGGRVKIGGEVWTARPYDDQLTIEAGKTVDVLTIEGVTAYVHESEKPWLS